MVSEIGEQNVELENGTNVAIGTKFLEEPGTRILPWYIPSQAKGTRNWKEKFAKLRSRFDRLIDETCASECILVQGVIPAVEPRSFEPPVISPASQPLWASGGLMREPARLWADGKPLVGLFPFMGARGEPLVAPDGSPAAYRLGLTRFIRVNAFSDGMRLSPFPHLEELMRDGGDLLYQLPAETAIRIWKNWPSGFSQSSNQGRSLWADALFEMSWQHPCGSPAHTKRSAWIGNFSVGLPGADLFPRLPRFMNRTIGENIPNDHGYPRAFVSRFSDVARASVAAIDEILECEPRADSPGNAESTAREPIDKATDSRTTVAHVDTKAHDSVFISYSHKDKKFLDQFLTHLKPLVRAHRLTSWSDQQIVPGSQWYRKIQDALSQTKVAVLLVTPNFLASDFICDHELAPLLKDAGVRGVTILWVPVRASAYKSTALKDYQSVIPPSKPLAEMTAQRDKAWVKICEAIEKAVNT